MAQVRDLYGRERIAGRKSGGYASERSVLVETKKAKKLSPVYDPTGAASINKGAISAKTTKPIAISERSTATKGNQQVYTSPVQRTKAEMQTAARNETTEDAFRTEKLLEGIVRKGTANAAHGVGAILSRLESAAFAPAEALTGFDDLQELHGLFYNWNKKIERERESAFRGSEANVKAGGTAARIADTIGTGIVTALPQAAMAMMSGGASLGAVGAKGLEATALAAQQSSGVLSSLQSAAANMANNPNFWTSFLRTAGESYEQAREDGASDGKASIYAVSNALLNAAVEVGGGLESASQNGTTARKWLKSAVQEGLEEPIQGVTERGLQRLVYGKKNPLFSTEDETAVFNPTTAAKEFGVGTAVGAALDGGKLAAGMVKQHGSILGNAAKQLISRENLSRYRSDIDAVFSGEYPSNQIIKMGETPEIYLQYGASQHPLTMKQSTAYKIAYPEGYFGGKHNLGMSVLKQLPYQIIDPVAILRSNTQDNSLVLLTKWKEGDKDIIIPIHLDSKGVIELENKVASAYSTGHIDSYIGKNGENVLYTKNGEDIHQLLDKGVQFPQLLADDVLAKQSIPYAEQNVKQIKEGRTADIFSNAVKPYAGTPGDYAALLKRLAKERTERETLTPERRRALEAWNRAFPELYMSEAELLKR